MPGLTINSQNFISRLQEIEEVVDTPGLLLNEELTGTKKWGFSWIVKVIAQPFLCCVDLFADVRIAKVSAELRRYLQQNQTFHFAQGRNQELNDQATALSQRIVSKLQERSHHRYDALVQHILEPFTENDPEAEPRHFSEQVQNDFVRHQRDLGDVRDRLSETLNNLSDDHIGSAHSERPTPQFEMPSMPETHFFTSSEGEPFNFHFQMPRMPANNLFSNEQNPDWESWDRAFDEWDRSFTTHWNNASRSAEERMRQTEERLRRSREATEERLRQSQDRLRQTQEQVNERLRESQERLRRTQEQANERLRESQERLRQTQEQVNERIREAQERARQSQEQLQERLRRAQEERNERIRESQERLRRTAGNTSSTQQPSAPRPSSTTGTPSSTQQPSAPRPSSTAGNASSTQQPSASRPSSTEQQESRRRAEEAARERARFENLFRPGNDRIGRIEAELCRLFGCQHINSAAELSAAFRRWARTNHPDRQPQEQQERATTLFQQVGEKVAQLRTARNWS